MNKNMTKIREISQNQEEIEVKAKVDKGGKIKNQRKKIPKRKIRNLKKKLVLKVLKTEKD